MRINSVMPAVQAQYRNNTQSVKKSNQTIPLSMNTPTVQSGVIIHFTGSDKKIHQFASYAPENKRFKSKMYDQGGLGVVAKEAPESWRLHENADVRDFAPYHSYGNDDGGVRVIKIKKGHRPESLPETSFFSAGQNETLEDIAKRLKLDVGEELHYAIQMPPNADGKSKYIRLVDAGVQGSFIRPSDTGIAEQQKVTYRLFRAPDISDLEGERNSAYFVHTEGLA